MQFYYFGGNFFPGFLNMLEKSNFTGVMFTYDTEQGDIFTKIIKENKFNEKLKYLIAIRPYAISPQYLCMINQSINSILGNRLQINLISGYLKDHEKNFGGIVGEVNDHSSKIDRSNYLIDYLNVLNTMPGNKNSLTPLDFYVSTTNQYTLDAAQVYNNKIILPYRDYKNGFWSKPNNQPGKDDPLILKDTQIMLAVTPIIRKTQQELDELPDTYGMRPVWREGEVEHAVTDIEYFTHDGFESFVKILESNGIDQLLINVWPSEEKKVIIEYINQYTKQKELESIKNN
jgi:hypothetical protein